MTLYLRPILGGKSMDCSATSARPAWASHDLLDGASVRWRPEANGIPISPKYDIIISYLHQLKRNLGERAAPQTAKVPLFMAINSITVAVYGHRA